MSSIITSAFRFFQAQTFIESFAYTSSKNNIYLGISKPTPWSDHEYSPDTPTESPRDNKEDWDEMLAIKKVVSSHIHNVVPRYDWINGERYQPWDDEKLDIWNSQFYVLTEAYNLYKCIDAPVDSVVNGVVNYKPSTICPSSTSHIGTFDTSDGYRWKFMGRVENVDVPYLSNQWIPLKTITDNEEDEGRRDYIQYNVQTSAINGTVDRIVLPSDGTTKLTVSSGKTAMTNGKLTQVTVTIKGDGEGAKAEAYGKPDPTDTNKTIVDKIVVTQSGKGYTWADVILTNVSHNTACRAIVSPAGGHGSNIVEELGGFYTMITVNFEQEEEGQVTVDNDFRKLILLCNPTNPDGEPLTAPEYDLRTQLHFSNVTPTVVPDDVIKHNETNFKGTVIDVDNDQRVVTLVNTSYDILPTTGVYTAEGTTNSSGNSQHTVDVDWVIKRPYETDVKKYSGKILYKDYRKVISRADDQTEQINIIFEF